MLVCRHSLKLYMDGIVAKAKRTTGNPMYKSPEWIAITHAVLERDHYQCLIRGPHCLGTATSTDHIIPRSKGGSNAFSNLQAACGPCNSHKKDKIVRSNGIRTVAW